VALDQGLGELPLALDDFQAVALELLDGRAANAELLALDDERCVELCKRLRIVPSGAVRARENESPQSHGASIGATAPKLRPDPHMGEATREVG
jgi:hypothetical protein